MLTSSASGSVGWFAASMMNLALISFAFSLQQMKRIYLNLKVTDIFRVLETKQIKKLGLSHNICVSYKVMTYKLKIGKNNNNNNFSSREGFV